jgi:antitoxin MazE
MSTAIRTRLIKIGNSQGVRIPKILLEQSGIGAEIEIEVHGNQLTIRTASQLRQGWDAAFAEMAIQNDDVLVDEIITTDWEENEWDW